MSAARLRDLGVVTGSLPPGPHNAITDVAGVAVGYTTIVRDGPATVRTGITAVWPRQRGIWTDPVFGGAFSFNGNGEMTGLSWLSEQGLIAAPIGITNTFSVGVVRDAICALAVREHAPAKFHLPIVAETYDGWLSASETFPITTADAVGAFDRATTERPAEGNVGGGTGMICHEFKGGTGTASRTVAIDEKSFVVGALVQANYGARAMLRVGGVPVGREIGPDRVPSHCISAGPAGSIIVIIASDAPLLPIQCQRLARRATTGIAWVGGYGANGSGDIFLAFTTANHARVGDFSSGVTMLAPEHMTPLFQAAAEATEEAILNALVAAETMTGRSERTVYALPHEELVRVVRRYRPNGPT